MPELGVNIDHVATLRQARKTYEPDPVAAAVLAELGGADTITIHLREDRRHIQDRDLRLLRETVAIKLNLELSVADEIIGIACQVKPDQATIVPEPRQIEQAKQLGADAVELHTGQYALARGAARHEQLVALTNAGKLVCDLGMHLHAGHGLNYHNVIPVARIPKMHELNIGHAIVARAVLVGLAQAVREMKQLVQ